MNDNNEETVAISKEEHNRLVEAEAFLLCLQDHGVDNWSGYSEAMEKYYGVEYVQ